MNRRISIDDPESVLGDITQEAREERAKLQRNGEEGSYRYVYLTEYISQMEEMAKFLEDNEIVEDKIRERHMKAKDKLAEVGENEYNTAETAKKEATHDVVKHILRIIFNERQNNISPLAATRVHNNGLSFADKHDNIAFVNIRRVETINDVRKALDDLEERIG